MKPQAQRTIEQSLDPEKQAKLLIEKERKIMKGLKIMLNWIKNNRGSISFVLTLVATICGYLIPEYGDLWIVGELKMLPLITGAISLVLGVKSFPISSSEKQELWNKATEVLKGSKATAEEKEKAKDIKYFKDEIKVLEKELKIIEKENAKAIEEFARANKYGLSISHDLRKTYDEYVMAKSSRENAKKQLEEKLALLEK